MAPVPEKRFVSRELELDLRRNRVITPSRPDPWFGSWPDPDAVLTVQQERELRDRGLDPETTPRMEAHLRCTMGQLTGDGRDMPYRRIVCPIVTATPDARGRIKVLAPIGDAKLVYPDGSLRAPLKLKWGARQ